MDLWQGARSASDRSPAPAPALLRSRVDPLAEQATVASLMAWPKQMDDVGRWLSSADFANPVNAAAFRAIERLAERGAPVDALTVTWEAQRAGGIVPDSALLEEYGHTAAPGQAEYAGQAVLGAAALDRLDHVGAHVTQLAADTSLSVPARRRTSSARRRRTARPPPGRTGPPDAEGPSRPPRSSAAPTRVGVGCGCGLAAYRAGAGPGGQEGLVASRVGALHQVERLEPRKGLVHENGALVRNPVPDICRPCRLKYGARRR